MKIRVVHLFAFLLCILWHKELIGGEAKPLNGGHGFAVKSGTGSFPVVGELGDDRRLGRRQARDAPEDETKAAPAVEATPAPEAKPPAGKPEPEPAIDAGKEATTTSATTTGKSKSVGAFLVKVNIFLITGLMFACAFISL